MTEFVTPQLRTVLKTYQDSATKSLQGPGLSLVHPLKKELLSPDLNDDLIVAPPPMPPEISQPILSSADTGRGVLYETLLEGKPIGCFLLGGEMRLCIPQILNNVLTDFTLDSINRIFDEQRIFCSQCTPEQLNEFKAAKILPEDVNASGLITRTNAERLCSALLHLPERRLLSKNALSFKVYHRCFGKCHGICTPELYSIKDPACIECIECRGWFSPQKFVCHVHHQENSTLHWGFDSNNWRTYLLVSQDEEHHEKYSEILDDLKERTLQDYTVDVPIKDNSCNLKRKADNVEQQQMLRPQLPCKQEPIDTPIKKVKQIDESYLLDYQYQAMILAQYRQQQFAFRPWAPFGALKHLAAHMPSYPTQLPYLSQEPPILQNPERVVRGSESDRFERSFQPNVALAPRKSTTSTTAQKSACNASDGVVVAVSKDRENPSFVDAPSPNIVHIKQERATTPPEEEEEEDEEEEDEEEDTTSVSPELNAFHPSVNNQQQKTTTPPPSSISPEGHSGSNEITSSTSPVPATLPPPPLRNNDVVETTAATTTTTSLHSPNNDNSVNTKILLDTNIQQSSVQENNIDHHHHHLHHPNTNNHPSKNVVAGSTSNIMNNLELELSTDTDDDSLAGEPDSSNKSASWDIAIEALKDTRPQERDKVLELIKMLVNENAQQSLENGRLLEQLKQKDEQIADLLRQQKELQQRTNEQLQYGGDDDDDEVDNVVQKNNDEKDRQHRIPRISTMEQIYIVKSPDLERFSHKMGVDVKHKINEQNHTDYNNEVRDKNDINLASQLPLQQPQLTPSIKSSFHVKSSPPTSPPIIQNGKLMDSNVVHQKFPHQNHPKNIHPPPHPPSQHHNNLLHLHQHHHHQNHQHPNHHQQQLHHHQHHHHNHHHKKTPMTVVNKSNQ